jgi:hypothetical protein
MILIAPQPRVLVTLARYDGAYDVPRDKAESEDSNEEGRSGDHPENH